MVCYFIAVMYVFYSIFLILLQILQIPFFMWTAEALQLLINECFVILLILHSECETLLGNSQPFQQQHCM